MVLPPVYPRIITHINVIHVAAAIIVVGLRGSVRYTWSKGGVR